MAGGAVALSRSMRRPATCANDGALRHAGFGAFPGVERRSGRWYQDYRPFGSAVAAGADLGVMVGPHTKHGVEMIKRSGAVDHVGADHGM